MLFQGFSANRSAKQGPVDPQVYSWGEIRTRDPGIMSDGTPQLAGTSCWGECATGRYRALPSATVVSATHSAKRSGHDGDVDRSAHPTMSFAGKSNQGTDLARNIAPNDRPESGKSGLETIPETSFVLTVRE
jgi:hypothetical protein